MARSRAKPGLYPSWYRDNPGGDLYDEAWGPSDPHAHSRDNYIAEPVEFLAMIEVVAAEQQARLNVEHWAALAAGPGRKQTWSDDDLKLAIELAETWSEVADLLMLKSSTQLRQRTNELGWNTDHFVDRRKKKP